MPHPSIGTEIALRQTKAKNSELRKKLAQALISVEDLQAQLEVFKKVSTRKVRPIQPREIRSGEREATWVALASDWHIEETVRPETVNGVNSYSVAIARKRVQRYFEGIAWLADYHEDVFHLRDGVLWLGGDLITGYLREESRENNECSPVQAIATLQDWIYDGIQYLLENTATESLVIPCSSGNHGRLTVKTHHSTREANSLEHLLYSFLATRFEKDPRVIFLLPEGSHTYLPVYDRTIRFLHGDDAKYGGGVGGVMIPIRKAMARWETFRHADLTCLGHFHQYHDLSDLVINSSLIGYNPYALSVAAQFEEPSQAFFLMDSKRGKCFPSKIWVAE